MRPHAHRAQADLHIRHDLALDQHDIAGYQRQHRHNHQRKQHRKNVWHDRVDHRSTSPSTISNVPITATTSATRCPRIIWSSASKLISDGGRMRTRYGCVVPSLTM